jgi:hypothetical protein
MPLFLAPLGLFLFHQTTETLARDPIAAVNSDFLCFSHRKADGKTVGTQHRDRLPTTRLEA